MKHVQKSCCMSVKRVRVCFLERLSSVKMLVLVSSHDYSVSRVIGSPYRVKTRYRINLIRNSYGGIELE